MIKRSMSVLLIVVGWWSLPGFTQIPATAVVIDHSPARTQQYIGSPSIAVLPSGEYLASHDFFGPGSTNDTTVVFASQDRGATWIKRATLKGQWWSTLFVHKGSLYVFGTTKENGLCVIRRSTDKGVTWTTPVDSHSGLLHGDGMFHCAPVPVIVHKGRIWRAMEEFIGPKWGKLKAFVMSAPENADLLDAASWTSTNRIAPTADWMDGKATSILEGNVVVTPKGEIVNILRVHQPDFNEVVAVLRVGDGGRSLSFDPKQDFIQFPGGSKKFTIRFDPKAKRYWSLVNSIPKEFRLEGRRPDQVRNTLSLVSSADLKKWRIERTIFSDTDVVTVGFQYVDWVFDGEEIIAVVRMAFPEADGTKAHNAHDANWMVFLRIEKRSEN